MSSCEIEEIDDPNGPSAEAYEEGATAGDLQLLVSGLQWAQRNDMEYYVETVSIVGREYYDLNSIDPRYTGELVGASGTGMDPGGFLTTRAYDSKHRATRNAHVLEVAATNSTVDEGQKSAYIGFGQTIRAYEMLLELGRQFENGIRLDTSDPQNLGPFSAGYQAGLTGIMDILEAGHENLESASDVPFVLSLGFEGFADKEGLIQFNHAIAARVALYMGDMGAASTALDGSFFDLAGDMSTGVYHTFSGNANDAFNPLFYIPGDEVDKYAIHATFLTDAEAGDTRVTSKTEAWGTTVTVDGLSGDTQIALFNSNTDGFPMIRNEELILIYAEANAGTPDATAAINVVRLAAGLPPYTGAMDAASHIDEILHQRRYSLVGEGHRWIDMRRHDRLDELPIDRDGDIIHVQFPRPNTD